MRNPCLRAIDGFRVGVVVVCLLLGGHAAGDDVANPSTRASPSGVYVLSIEPHAPDGSGFADYRLVRDGEEVWAGERPFCLWEAEVTDDGVVAGYAYEGGIHFGGHHGTEFGGLSICMLAPDGTVRLHEPAAYAATAPERNNWSGSDSPEALGVLVHSTLDRLAVRIAREYNAGGGEVWRTYRLSTGARDEDVVPGFVGKSDGFAPTVFARAIVGTPLTLVHQIVERQVGDGQTHGASVLVVSAVGEQVWRLELPGEYDGIDADWDWYWAFVKPGIVQARTTASGFAFLSHSLGAEVAYTVAADAGDPTGWRVRETGRTEAASPFTAAAERIAEVESIELELIGTITLKAEASAPSPIGGISDFGFDDAGNIGWVRWNGDGGMVLVRVDATGRIVSQTAVPLSRDQVTMLPKAVAAGGDRWVIAGGSDVRGESAGAWLFDAGSGELKPIEGIGSFASVQPIRGGGFVTVLPGNSQTGGSPSRVRRFDTDGALVGEVSGDGVSRFGSLKDAALLADGRLAVLIGVTNTIEIVETDGRHAEGESLEVMLGKKANYPVAISAHPDGGFVLHDFDGSPRVYRFDAEGAVIALFSPRFPDGREFRIYGGVQVAPDGSLWTSDRHSLLRLDEAGVVDLVLGAQPDDEGLDGARALAIGRDGRIFALNQRTAAVHVFDDAGNPLFICRPAPGDWAGDIGIGHITIDHEGGVFYDIGDFSDAHRGYLGFSATGERLGFGYRGRDNVGGDWLFEPGRDRRWVKGYGTLDLVDGDGEVIRSITKRPNGNWIESPAAAAVGPDGSLAVVTGSMGFGGRAAPVICIYDADGEPVRVIGMLDEGGMPEIAFNGSTIVTMGYESAHLYDVADGTAQRIVLPMEGAEEQAWYPFFSPDGTELWLHAWGSLEVVRFRLP